MRRSSRVKHLQSPQKPRAGNASRPQDVISESRTRTDGRRVTARSNGSRPGKSRRWRRRSRERFPLQRARGFTNRGAETGNVHAKPRRIQPRESENSEQSTRGENGRQRSEPRRQKCATCRNRAENARAGTNKIIALLLPCPLLPVPGGNLSKLGAGSSKNVSGVPRCHF